MPLLGAEAGCLVRSEGFDNLSTLTFLLYGTGRHEVVDGRLAFSDQIAPDGDPWNGEAAGRSIFSPRVGNVSVFLFEVDPNTFFGFHYELYENTDAGEQYWGINLDGDGSSVSLNIDKGLNGSHPTQWYFTVASFKRDTWYLYSLQAQPDGAFTAKIWERDRPNTMIFNTSFQLNEEWTQPGFTFVITVYQGKMEVDAYQEVEPAK